MLIFSSKFSENIPFLCDCLGDTDFKVMFRSSGVIFENVCALM